MADSDWLTAARLAGRLDRAIDLDVTERDYKIAHAAKVREFRELVESDSPQWPEGLRRALKVNLVHYMTVERVLAVVNISRTESRAALLRLWSSQGNGEDLAAFYDFFHRQSDEVRIGAALTTASVLLLAKDPTSFAPYQTEVINRFARLVGEEPADAYDVAARWDQFMRLLGEFQRHANAGGLELADNLDAQGAVFALLKTKLDGLADAALADDLAAWRGDTGVSRRASIERRTYDSPVVEDAGWRILKAGLTGAPSPLTGAPSAWTAGVAASVARRNANEEVAGEGTYMEKFERQLTGASADEYTLAAELIYLHHLPLMNVNASTKIERVEQIAGWAGQEWPLPDWMKRGVEAGGAFNGGQGYSAQRWRHMVWLCDFVAHWAALTQKTRDDALESPWDFAAVLEGLEPDVAAMRYVLTYFAWPNVFTPIVSPAHRRSIRDAFAHEIGGSTGTTDIDIARDLYDIRSVLEERRGGFVDFYVSPFVEQWQTDKTRRAWIIKVADDPEATWARWQAEGEVSLLAPEVSALSGGFTFDQVSEAMAEAHGDLDSDTRGRRAREVFAFSSRVKESDLIVTLVDGSLRFAEAVGGMASVPDSAGELAIPVTWLEGTWALADAVGTVQSALEVPGTVTEVTQLIAALDSMASGAGLPPIGGGDRPVSELTFTPLTAQLEAELHMPLSELERFASLLKSRKQMVFYGPPGTGKTFIARRLARALAGEDRTDAVTLVQFHPSYSYEDFFEGYRPSETSTGAATFTLTNGPLRRIATEASNPANAHKPYFLIIDEMNRGNLAKVFGELYFLLEYRNQSVSPQYSPGTRFTLPDNLFIVGTMNTTDRSVGLVDAAIRRRFPFVELHPDTSPVEGVLGRYLASKGISKERAGLLRALNASITTRDLRIGPSYLMRPEADTEEGLEQVWTYDILPLLQEHFYESKSPDAIAREFSLTALRRRIAEEPSGDVGTN
jgi:5-methylcytosine-specific restriction enzyme B